MQEWSRRKGRWKKKYGNTLTCQNANSILSPEPLIHISKVNVVSQWSQWSYLMFSAVQCSPRGAWKISAYCCYLFLPKENAELMNKEKKKKRHFVSLIRQNPSQHSVSIKCKWTHWRRKNWKSQFWGKFFEILNIKNLI